MTWVLNVVLEPPTNHVLANRYINLRLSSKFLVPCTPAYHYTNSRLSLNFLAHLNPKSQTPREKLLCALTPSCVFSFLLRISLDKNNLRKRRLPWLRNEYDAINALRDKMF